MLELLVVVQHHPMLRLRFDSEMRIIRKTALENPRLQWLLEPLWVGSSLLASVPWNALWLIASRIHNNILDVFRSSIITCIMNVPFNVQRIIDLGYAPTLHHGNTLPDIT